jgi:Protein of unknown function (DUF1376)
MKRPWMALYVGDYLGDTGHLTTAQHGAYLLLMMHYWRKGELPYDDRQLSKITKLPLKTWCEYRPYLHHRKSPLISLVFSLWRPHLTHRCGNRSSGFDPGHLVCGTGRKTFAVRRSRVERGHLAAAPSEQGFQLGLGCAVIGGRRRRGFPDPVR